ncbi:MAG: MATE family efflux transporter, partial [Nitrospirae bacterium]
SSLLAGHLDTAAVAAHHVALNLAALSFMMPLGISQAVVTRVGNLLGAGRPQAAQRAARVGLLAGAGVMGISAVLFVVFRTELPRLYTPDPGVVALAASVLPIAAAFQIFDGTQVVGCGVLRGMGHTRPAAWFNFLGYWVLGLPVGAALAFRGGLGLAGIWWGLCLGLGAVAALLVGYVHFRGPGSGAAP